LPSTAEQLLLPWQLTVPPNAQLASAVHRDFCPPLPVGGRLAAGTGEAAPRATAREAKKARSAALIAGAARGESAALAGEMRKASAAQTRKSPREDFFMVISFPNEAHPRGKPPRNPEYST